MISWLNSFFNRDPMSGKESLRSKSAKKGWGAEAKWIISHGVGFEHTA